MKLYLSCIITLLVTINNFAADTLVISNTKDDYNYMVIGEYLDIFEDTSNNFSINDILINSQLQFNQWDEPNRFPYIRSSKSTYWIRFSIKASDDFDG